MMTLEELYEWAAKDSLEQIHSTYYTFFKERSGNFVRILRKSKDDYRSKEAEIESIMHSRRGNYSVYVDAVFDLTTGSFIYDDCLFSAFGLSDCSRSIQQLSSEAKDSIVDALMEEIMNGIDNIDITNYDEEFMESNSIKKESIRCLLFDGDEFDTCAFKDRIYLNSVDLYNYYRTKEQFVLTRVVDILSNNINLYKYGRAKVLLIRKLKETEHERISTMKSIFASIDEYTMNNVVVQFEQDNTIHSVKVPITNIKSVDENFTFLAIEKGNRFREKYHDVDPLSIMKVSHGRKVLYRKEEQQQNEGKCFA